MTTQISYTIISGKFARVAGGNCTEHWLIEGADLQERANANMNPYWRTEGVSCAIYDRNVEGHALALNGKPTSLYLTLEAAQAALDRQAAVDAAYAARR